MIPGASAAVQALAVVLVVFLEAVVLYVGYGLLEHRVAPPVLDTIVRL